MTSKSVYCVRRENFRRQRRLNGETDRTCSTFDGERAMTQHALGGIVIQRIVESVCLGFDASGFFPETTPDDWARHRTWMEPWALDPSGKLVLPIQAFLVRTRHHTILIDTCVGDHKPRPLRPFWHMQKLNTFLPRLAAAGVAPEDVDYVMCTHLHWDHVGWNTQLRDGRWVPTFPKAKYIFAKREWESFEALHRRVPQPQWVDKQRWLRLIRQISVEDNWSPAWLSC